ncbi:MAG: hypothetical protein M1820_002686 [Bogoriella megaspora]|nr:MAG: hypothetical protein M1820_002686 [Bogoriella megaspora]
MDFSKPALPSSLLYPVPSAAALQQQFVGRRLQDVNPPAAVIDVAIVRRNCESMLEAAKALDVGFRAHVKTHKTTELTRLQVGKDAEEVKLIVSTVAEAEQLVPYLLECTSQGRSINLLYGVPPPPSAFPRLAALADLFGPHSISVLIDSFGTVVELLRFAKTGAWARPISFFIKVDTGYHRAGAAPQSQQMEELLDMLAICSEDFQLKGFYSHMGHSYGFDSPSESLDGLIAEIEGATKAADQLVGPRTRLIAGRKGKLTITVGSTPTVTATQNIFSFKAGNTKAKLVSEAISKYKEKYDVELHAGVYPVLDLQQVATHARPPSGQQASELSALPTYLSTEYIGLRILVEVNSVYQDRGQPQALIAAGTLALGREPCKSYPGWGIVTPWQQDSEKRTVSLTYSEDKRTGWIVGKISQEHGILTWEGPEKDCRKLEVGDKLMVWPNHACVAGAGFGWYLVVNSGIDDPDLIIDVWVRWRGW